MKKQIKANQESTIKTEIDTKLLEKLLDALTLEQNFNLTPQSNDTSLTTSGEKK
jgi:hypothetical protein